jgi:hypothetical protein
MLGGGLLVLDGWLVGDWLTGGSPIAGAVVAVLVALGLGWLGMRRWQRRKALLPRDIGGGGLFWMAVLVGLIWLCTSAIS